MEDELMNDELPSPPVGGAAEGRAVDDELDASLLADVPKMGDALPAGTYAFRLEKFYEQWSEKDMDTGRVLADSEKQPSFGLQWRCQQEPFVGRVVLENVPWVRSEDAKAANDPQNPRRGEAKAIINKALPRAKQIMTEAGFEPKGNFGFKQFLASTPEMKLQLNVKEKKQQVSGKWVGTGEFKNGVVKHLSMSRPV